MKCIVHSIKSRYLMSTSILGWIILLTLLLGLGACASKSSKVSVGNNSHGKASIANSSRSQKVKPAVSNAVKKEYEQALTLIQSGEKDKPEEILRRIAEKRPDIAGPQINLGIIRLKQGDLLEAEQHFLIAKKIHPENAIIYNYLGIVFRKQGRFMESEKAYKQALDLDSNLSNVYLNLGILNDLYLNNFDAAKENYKEYQKIVPGNEDIKNWISDLNNRTQASKE